MNQYRGCPLYVTCIFPLGLIMCPISEALTPAVTVGVPVVSRGGHAVAHLPVHELVVEVSVENA